MTLLELFWRKVDKRGPDECWPWRGRLNEAGYGRYATRSLCMRAHRLAYTLLVGPIPAGLQIDHLCRNRACVNPAHLEPVTQRENILRGTALSAQRARQTHCKRNHAFTASNTYRDSKGRRVCITCRRARDRARSHRKRVHA